MDCRCPACGGLGKFAFVRDAAAARRAGPFWAQPRKLVCGACGAALTGNPHPLDHWVSAFLWVCIACLVHAVFLAFGASTAGWVFALHGVLIALGAAGYVLLRRRVPRDWAAFRKVAGE